MKMTMNPKEMKQRQTQLTILLYSLGTGILLTGGLLMYEQRGAMTLMGTVSITLLLVTAVPNPLQMLSTKILESAIGYLIMVIVNATLVLYAIVRFTINIVEYLFQGHGRLRRKLQTAYNSYKEWHNCASELDKAEGRDLQNTNYNDNADHNWDLIKDLLDTMRSARNNNDAVSALVALQQATARNVGGILSGNLYAQTNTGEPQQLVLDFVQEVEECMDWVVTGVEKSNRVSTAPPAPLLSFPSPLKKAFKRGPGSRRHLLSGSITSVASDESASVSYNAMFRRRSCVMTSSSRKIDFAATAAMIQNLDDDLLDEETEEPTLTTETEEPPVRAIENDPELAAIHRDKCFSLLRRARAAYGRTALSLSGGGSNAISSLGVLRAMFDERVLPKVISGTSAGSFQAAFVGVRTDKEIETEMNPELMSKFADVGLFYTRASWWDILDNLGKHGCLFTFGPTIESFRWICKGDMTFEEAYRRTGRVLNITVSSTTKNASATMLNYMSAPNVTIVSAVMASCSIPGIFPPARLFIKTEDGKIVPRGGESSHETYVDGSVDMDIPTSSLKAMLNCSYIITVQSNPHVVLFSYNDRPSVAKPHLWESTASEGSLRGGLVLSSLEFLLKQSIFVLLKLVGKWNNYTSLGEIVGQTQESDVVLITQQRLRRYLKPLHLSTFEEWRTCFVDGAIPAFQHMALMKINTRVADVLDKSLDRLGATYDKAAVPVVKSTRASFNWAG